MVEFPYRRRESITTQIFAGINATILGATPPQMSLEITEVVVSGFGATVTGRLMQFATLQGYTDQGTIIGTVVEPFSAAPGSSFVDGSGAAMVARVAPGCLLYGVVDAGSVLAKVTFRYRYDRG